MGATMTPAVVPQPTGAAAPGPGLPNTMSVAGVRPNVPAPMGAMAAPPAMPTSVAGIQQPDLITSPVAGESPALGASPIKQAFILSVFYKFGFPLHDQAPDGAVPGAAAGAAIGAGAHLLSSAGKTVYPKVPAVRTPDSMMNLIGETLANKQRVQDNPMRNLLAVLKNRGLLGSVAGAARAVAPAALGGAAVGALIQRARKNHSD